MNEVNYGFIAWIFQEYNRSDQREPKIVYNSYGSRFLEKLGSELSRSDFTLNLLPRSFSQIGDEFKVYYLGDHLHITFIINEEYKDSYGSSAPLFFNLILPQSGMYVDFSSIYEEIKTQINPDNYSSVSAEILEKHIGKYIKSPTKSILINNELPEKSFLRPFVSDGIPIILTTEEGIKFKLEILQNSVFILQKSEIERVKVSSYLVFSSSRSNLDDQIIFASPSQISKEIGKEREILDVSKISKSAYYRQNIEYIELLRNWMEMEKILPNTFIERWKLFNSGFTMPPENLGSYYNHLQMLHTAKQEYDNVKADSKNQETIVNNKRQQVAKLENKFDLTQSDISRLSRKVEISTITIDENKRKILELKKEIEKLSSDIAQAKITLNKLEKDSTDIETMLTSERQGLLSEKEKLEEIKQVESEKSNYLDELNHLKDVSDKWIQTISSGRKISKADIPSLDKGKNKKQRKFMRFRKR